MHPVPGDGLVMSKAQPCPNSGWTIIGSCRPVYTRVRRAAFNSFAGLNSRSMAYVSRPGVLQSLVRSGLPRAACPSAACLVSVDKEVFFAPPKSVSSRKAKRRISPTSILSGYDLHWPFNVRGSLRSRVATAGINLHQSHCDCIPMLCLSIIG